MVVWAPRLLTTLESRCGLILAEPVGNEGAVFGLVNVSDDISFVVAALFQQPARNTRTVRWVDNLCSAARAAVDVGNVVLGGYAPMCGAAGIVNVTFNAGGKPRGGIRVPSKCRARHSSASNQFQGTTTLPYVTSPHPIVY